MSGIKFGTDGWRAKIAEEFTFENLEKITKAYAAAELEKTKKPRVAVGYDNRFLSEKYAVFVSEILARHGFAVHLFDAAVPTPLVSWTIVRKKLDSGIVITSSHNPFTYNGFKIKNSSGAGASGEETGKVERYIVKPRRLPLKKGSITKINMDDQYVTALASIVDVNAIKRSGMKIVVDAMYGPGAGYMEKALNGYKNIKTIHGYRDPLFGGITPEPVRKNLLELEEAVKSEKADIGVALDGDGDRMAFVDDKGRYASPHKVLVFLLLHHIKNKKMKFRFVKTIAGTALLNTLAAEYSVELLETPVGFKHIGSLMARDSATIGGEESGGVGFGYYLPERDGIIGNLMLLEFLAAGKKKASAVLAQLDEKYGKYEYARLDLKFMETKRRKLMDTAAGLYEAGKISGKAITGISRLDGIKYMLGDNEWVLFRFSGTEPLLRIYSEAPSKNAADDNLKFCAQALGF